jgi:hypothetical protein
MADSRLTDLPNLTTPNSDDVLYIVNVTQDSSNKITYANLVTNTIDSLSAYLDTIKIPSINDILTDVANLSVTQLTKANQTDLNTTNTNLNTLESNVLVYSSQTTKNAGDIVALSGYIDGNASISDLNATNTRVDEVSASVLTKASQADLALKASQNDLNALGTNVNIISGDVLTNSVIIANNEARIDIAEDDIIENTQRIFTLRSETPDLTSFFTLQDSVSTNDDRLEFALDSFRYLAAAPLDFTIASMGNIIYKYEIPTFIYGPLSADGFSTAYANISSYIPANNTWKGLQATAYVVEKNIIEVSIFNPTAGAIVISGADICLRGDGRRVTWLSGAGDSWYGNIPTSPATPV